MNYDPHAPRIFLRRFLRGVVFFFILIALVGLKSLVWAGLSAPPHRVERAQAPEAPRSSLPREWVWTARAYPLDDMFRTAGRGRDGP